MIDFNSVAVVKSQLEVIQNNEKDQRELARDCDTFVNKVDGQWEPRVWEQWGTLQRPRYNFDRTTPIIDLIVGELEQNEFAATVSPAGGEATKEVAQVYDGILRAIQNRSDASSTYKKIARKMVIQGFDAMRVKTQYKDADSFEQEIVLEHIPNAIDRVWFDPNSEKQNGSDAEFVYVMQALTKDAYKEQFPTGSGESIGNERLQQDYWYKRETVIVGQIYYKKRESREIVQLDNGMVIEAEKFDPVKDAMALQGMNEVKRREREIVKVYTRMFDGDNWLNDEVLTSFNELPIVPFFHCFEISEDKRIWRRIVEKLMDPQRIYNYAKSRQIEEGALAPREKTWMTREQAKGHEGKLGSMNTNPDPIQFYNVDSKGAPPPYKTSPPSVNPALQTTAQDAAMDIEAISGMYAANLAKNPGNQSGKALGIQIDKGDTGNVSFYADMSIGITQLCKVCVGAIPVVHDAKEVFNVLRPDGTREDIEINTVDKETMQPLNDLTQGSYTVLCGMGPMFKNRLEKGNDAMIQVSQVMPEIMQNGADIFLRNIDAPNMDALAERARSQLVSAGLIPEDQLTDEELQEIQAAQQQQGQQPDPMIIAAMAEQQKAEAELVNAQTNQAESQIDMFNAETKRIEAMVKAEEAGVKVTGMNIDNQLKAYDAAEKQANIEGKQLDNAAKMDEMTLRNASTEDLIRAVLG